MTDTVGFIRKLPHQLVDAFGATLEETRLAELMLHVVDAPRPRRSCPRCCARSTRCWRRSARGSAPRLLVLNKADLLDEERRRELRLRHPDGMLVSAAAGDGLERLRERIEDEFVRAAPIELLMPYAEGGRLAELHESPATWSARTRPRACS